MISLRTKDEVTFAASERLFARAYTPQQMLDVPESEIASLIFPAGFYRTKASNIREVSRIIMELHDGSVPRSAEDLTALPGVGLKTANLVLGLGFGIPAICVDTHVHRIANRLGWIHTKNALGSEDALRQLLPESLWIETNELLVSFGQSICTPQSPWCSRCPLAGSVADDESVANEESLAANTESGPADSRSVVRAKKTRGVQPRGTGSSQQFSCARVGVTNSR
jgi:endonuclease-3